MLTVGLMAVHMPFWALWDSSQGAAVVAAIGSYWTLGIDALSFGISAFIPLTAVRPRPGAQRMPGKRPTMWSVSAYGIRIVFRNPVLMLLFG